MSDSEVKPNRRLIVPQKPAQVRAVTIDLVPDVNKLIDDALGVVAMEIHNFKGKVQSGKSLDLSEARVLQGYIKSLTDMSKEMRERESAADLANLTDNELLAYVEKVRAKLQSTKVEEPPHGEG